MYVKNKINRILRKKNNYYFSIYNPRTPDPRQ